MSSSFIPPHGGGAYVVLHEPAGERGQHGHAQCATDHARHLEDPGGRAGEAGGHLPDRRVGDGRGQQPEPEPDHDQRHRHQPETGVAAEEAEDAESGAHDQQPDQDRRPPAPPGLEPTAERDAHEDADGRRQHQHSRLDRVVPARVLQPEHQEVAESGETQVHRQVGGEAPSYAGRRS
jgi:hypothetical protein